MDNLALSLSKSITEFLEQNEKRFVRITSHQEKHEKLLGDLNNRVEQLETRCQELLVENKSLKCDLETIKQREDATMRDMITTKSDLDKMHTRLHKCEDWVDLMAELIKQVEDLRTSRKANEEKVEDLAKNQTDLTSQLEQQQRHLKAAASTAQAAANAVASVKASVSASVRSSTTSTAPLYSIKTPSRSPSTASFFNGNMNRLQSSTPRVKQSYQFNNNSNQANNNHHLTDHHNHHHPQPTQFLSQEPDYNGSIDANDGMLSEMSDHAESLLNHVQFLNDLHQRSFGGSSLSPQ